MPVVTPKSSPERRLRRWLLYGAACALLIWLGFFDSHSLYKRVRWHHELHQLQEENADLEGRIRSLRTKVEEAESDEVVEKIAREQYGMRRPGERVYRLEAQP